MGQRLVTIATFDQAAQARLAKNVLDEAGIQSAVSDETLVAMDWLLSNAVGGVKVQVREEDAEKAVAVLESKFGAGGEGLGTGVSEEELAAEAEAAPPDEGEDAPPPPIPGEEDTVPSSEREDYARRAVFTSILALGFAPGWFYFPLFALLCLPLVFYALYLLLNAMSGKGELSARGRLHLTVGGILTVVNVLCLYGILKLIGEPS